MTTLDTTTAAQPRAVLISTAYKPAVRIVNYLTFLLEHGVGVDFVVWDEARWREMEMGIPEGVRFHSFRDAENRQFIRWTEHLLVYRLPGGALAAVHRLVVSNPVTRPLGRGVAAIQWLHGKVAGAFHRWIFIPFYRLVRPQVVSRVAARTLREVDLGNVTRIVAGDPYAITYAWKLAKRYPDAAASTGLDRHPYGG